MAKPKKEYICENCGNTEPKWVGKCPKCGEWNTYVENEIAEVQTKAFYKVASAENKYISLSEVDLTKSERVGSGFLELDRVLGGGFIRDEVLLISGEPGIGKSTLLLQVAQNLSKNKKILYVSAEESESQVANRAKRLFGREEKFKEIIFSSNGSIQKILSYQEKLDSEVVIIDSIQTIFDEELNSLPGGLAQIKSATSKLVYTAKSRGIILIFIGHINKEGNVAGPKMLEHLVDCVINLEGHRNGEYRILRSFKNRFGSTGEVGLFNMTEKGLEDIDHAKNFLSLSDAKKEIGVAKSVVVEGSRPIVLDIQALVNKTSFAYPKRVTEGISNSRLQVLSAITESLKISKLTETDVYLRTSGGYQVKNYPYLDLGIVAALVSSFKKTAIDQSFIFLGEVSLNGTVFLPSFMKKHVSELLKIYSDSKIVTNSRELSLKTSKIISISNIKELSKVIQ